MTFITPQTANLDPAFGEGGRLEVRTPGNLSNDLSRITLDSSGRRLLIYGTYKRVTSEDQLPGVAALIDSGALDTRFGDMQDGLTIPPATQADRASDIAKLANESFFITGHAQNQLPLIHYDKDGKFISSRDIAEGPQSSIPSLLGLDEKLLVATTNRTGGVVYGRHADGTEDNSFGTGGKASYLTGNTYVAIWHTARSTTTSAFYLAGEVGNYGFILRMTTSGEQDSNFANDGVYLISIFGNVNGCRKVIELSDGKILALINGASPDTGGASALIRLTATGRIDTTFNRGEPLRIPGDIGEDLALQADGKILVAHRGVMTGNRLTRYLPGGGLDLEFGNDESGSITFTNDQLSFVKSVMVQPDGKIVVGGKSGSTTTLLRLLA